MQQALLTVDLGFGDAGKGSIVDFLAREHTAHTVVRYNGGAQAAHRVVTSGPNPHEHVFAQFGSGIQGAVAHPGDYSLEGRMTVLRLLAQAGGFSEFAKRDQVSIFREEAGAVRRYLFDYGAFLAGNFDQNILLREDDIVIVP